MRDFSDATIERKAFKATITVDDDTTTEWKLFTSPVIKQVLIGVPTTGFFITLVIITQLAMRYWQIYLTESYAELDEPVPVHLKYSPSLINSVLIVAYGTIYKKVAYFLLV